MAIEDVRRAVYPEVHAGGFSDNDGSILFYARINALLRDDMSILDFGAGRGVATLTDPCEYRRRLRTLKGKVARVVGVDVDEAVKTNPNVDDAYVASPGAPLPFGDAEFDLIVADYVLEHICTPVEAAQEIGRVLKAGGWLVARTPNSYGYVAVATKCVPKNLQRAVLRWINPAAGGRDNFPVCLRMNSLRALRRLFPVEQFEHFSYVRRFEGMGYFGWNEAVLRVVRALMHFVPRTFGPEIIVLIRKR